MKKNIQKVRARVVKAKEIELTKRLHMYSILENYYQDVNWSEFQHDLSEKTHVILLENPETGICGFSTILCKEIVVDGKSVTAVFSGDTILEKRFWGSPALGIQFLVYLWRLRLRNPFKPVYWLLISKGYKTYLLMANNFAWYFPHIKRETPEFEKNLMLKFYSSKFGKNYDHQTGIINFGSKATAKLKSNVAPISKELSGQVPKIGFFEAKNPHWQEGNELACVARMTFLMPVQYVLKKIFSRNKKLKLGTQPIYTDESRTGQILAESSNAR